jgi:repressor LexA
MNPPTDRQREILAFIREWTQKQKYPPSWRDIGDHFGITSSNGVDDHLQALKKRGLVAWGPQCSRTLRLTNAGYQVLIGEAA